MADGAKLPVTEVSYIKGTQLPGPPNDPPTHTWPADDHHQPVAGDPQAVPSQLRETGPRRTIDVEPTAK